MEVTKSNFKEILPEIEQAIKNCLFLSIDCELTGLKTALNNVSAFDTPEQYYQKAIKDCSQFLVIQYGITLFRFDEALDGFKYKSYNFYIFRRPLNKFVADQRFLCQTSSIDFLINNQFDFNKLFTHGISYLNQAEEEKCRTVLEEQHKKRKDFLNSSNMGNRDVVPIPEENQEFVDDIEKKLTTFLDSDAVELQLPKCNAFLRRLIYQTNSQKFADRIHLETREGENKDRLMFATRLKSRQKRDEIELKKHEELVEQMADYVGFSQVIRMIVESDKIVVGHNLLLDYLHTIDKFLTPLPDDYLDFKECASSLLSKVIDTKYMASTPPFKELIQSTVLGQLLESVLEPPFGVPKYELEEGGIGYSIKDKKEHEAGYDSFITGLSFLAMWKYLGADQTDVFGKSGQNLLSPYLNRIFLMFLTDNQFLNLAGPDLNPSRDHVFYITFPREWTTNNLVQLFSPFGSVYISWLTDSSAYVGLYKRDQAAVALRTLSQSDTYRITPFARRQALLSGLKTIKPSPVKRRRSNEGPPHVKRFKSDAGSFIKSIRYIEPIEEEEQEAEAEEEEKEEESKSASKTFAECDTWE